MPGFQRLLPEFRNYPRAALTCAHHVTCAQYSRLADRGEGLVIFADEKHFRVIFSDFGRISCDFRLDIRDFGKKM